MTPETMHEWLNMRDGFSNLRLEPETHSPLLFGERDRDYRDELMNGIEEGYLAGEGHKAVRYGDYGRGKTHQSRNLVYEIGRREMPVKPLYVKCTEFAKKASFSELFGPMISALGTQDVHETAAEFERTVNTGSATPLDNILTSEEVALVFGTLTNPNTENVRYALRWLSGDTSMTKGDRNNLPGGLGPPVSVSSEYADVMRGFIHMYREVHGQILLFFIDEAERLNQITHDDTFWSWNACLRELMEIVGVGFVFLVGGKTRDDLPVLLTQPEVLTRIGATNFKDIVNPGKEELRAWVLELLQTFFQKGEVPEPLKDGVREVAGRQAIEDDEIADGIMKATGGDPEALEAYPFTPESLEMFVTQCVTEELANKPREVLKRMRKAAAKTVISEKERIDEEIVEQVQGEGF